MKTLISLLGMVLIVIVSHASAQNEGQLVPQDKLQFSLAPSVGVHLGYTKYVMDLKYQEENFVIARIKSELKFPLDMLLIGGQLDLSYFSGGERDWALSAAVHTNVNDPWSEMIDDDWDGTTQTRLEQFSHTESNAELSAIMVDLTATRYFHHGRNTDLGLVLGLIYQRLDYDIIGYKGWKNDSLGVRQYVSSTADALDYVVTYTMPTFGAELIYGTQSRSKGRFVVSAGPVFASDYDNHLLRNKDATADGTGYGITSEFTGRFPLSTETGGQQVYLGLDAALAYMHVEGEQTQTWYGNDDATEDFDDTGLVLTKIPHDFTSLQYRAGLKLIMTF